ncbi:MAG: hypothetical protein C4575_09565 [Desulforudis sp.]|jgi:hypothetical protein|nr:MAG: hypothetical protein C4575_09565 [Desulforudis sp.]
MEIIKEKDMTLKGIVQALAADDLINEYLGRAKVLLDGGAWWKRVKAYLGVLNTAYADQEVSPAEFKAKLDALLTGLRKGCRRVQAGLEKKKAA